jgi:hypothetical protein
LAKKGTKALHGKTSSSRELITVIACGNAAGGYLPPHFVFPGKTKRKLDGYDIESTTGESCSIKGANFSVSDSGWTKDGIAKLWFSDTFLKHIGPSRPQLLICDGHGSHNNLEFLELAKENDIILVELPSHTSQWTQPLDRSVFKSLKSHWNTTVDNFIRETGVSVGNKQFLKLFNVAWQKSLTPSTIRNGFEATGIYPFNPNAIPDEAFAPNLSAQSGDNAPAISNPTNLETNITVPQPANATQPHPSNGAVVSSAANGNTEDFTLQLEEDPLAIQDVEPLYGLLCDYAPSEMNDNNHVTTCSNNDALAIIESTMTNDQKLMFQAALLAGKKTKLEEDPLFQSWRHYVQLQPLDVSGTYTVQQTDVQFSNATELTNNSSVTAVADEVFPVPKPMPTKSKKKGSNKEYFVLTAGEIIDQKRQSLQLKMQQAEVKEQKRIARERKRAEKLLKTNSKKSKCTNVVDML